MNRDPCRACQSLIALFAFTENEKISDSAHVQRIVEAYKRLGFVTALDDFGSRYAGLGLLASFQPDLIKIDVHPMRGIDTSPSGRASVAGIASIARALDITVLAEGIETEVEARTVRTLGMSPMQGHLFARPERDRLPPVMLGHLSIPAVA